MPVQKVRGGYRWGEKGKVYPDRASAERQGRAIKASQAQREREKKESLEELPKYMVIDWYEGKDVLYEGDSYREAVRAAKEQIEDTDGECDVCLYKSDLDGNYQPYKDRF